MTGGSQLGDFGDDVVEVGPIAGCHMAQVLRQVVTCWEDFQKALDLATCLNPMILALLLKKSCKEDTMAI